MMRLKNIFLFIENKTPLNYAIVQSSNNVHRFLTLLRHYGFPIIVICRLCPMFYLR